MQKTTFSENFKEIKPARNKLPNRDAGTLRYEFYSWQKEKPKAKRKYRTQRAWAIAHGIRPETVSRWKRRYVRLELIDSRARELYFRRHGPFMTALLQKFRG